MLEVTWTSLPPAPDGSLGDSPPETAESSAEAAFDEAENAGDDLRKKVGRRK